VRVSKLAPEGLRQRQHGATQADTSANPTCSKCRRCGRHYRVDVVHNARSGVEIRRKPGLFESAVSAQQGGKVRDTSLRAVRTGKQLQGTTR